LDTTRQILKNILSLYHYNWHTVGEEWKNTFQEVVFCGGYIYNMEGKDDLLLYNTDDFIDGLSLTWNKKKLPGFYPTGNSDYSHDFLTQRVPGAFPIPKNTCTGKLSNSIIQHQVIIYPNPTKNNFTVETEEENIKDVSVYDNLFRLIQNVENVNSNATNLSLENQPNGIYFVKIKSVSDKVSVQKVVKSN